MRKFYRELLKSFFISILLAVAIRYFLFQPFKVEGASMQPNFYSGDYLIVDEVSYHFHNIHRGDVVVFHHNSSYYIKRIIGLPGELVQIKQGYVYINGNILDEPVALSSKTNGDISIVLNNDEYFVLGDNRSASSDSRFFGPLHKKKIVGKVMLRLFPLTRIKLLGNNYL